LVLFATCTTTISAQGFDYEIPCNFIYSSFYGYGCRLTGIEVIFPNLNIIFTGNHTGGRNNANVTYVEIIDSMTPYIIQSIFTTFVNIERLEVLRSGISTLQFPETNQLREFVATDGLIGVLRNRTFSGQRNLQVIRMTNCNITEIEDEAFMGLTQLERLSLIRNRVTRIPQFAFHHTPALQVLDFERNNLTRVESTPFRNCTQLERIFFEYNQILDIEGDFTRPFVNTLTYINLSGNVCVDRSFNIFSEIDFRFFKMVLQNCFTNFRSGPDGWKRVTLELQGPMSLFDEFGNLVARVN
jgi:hypothetical protein